MDIYSTCGIPKQPTSVSFAPVPGAVSAMGPGVDTVYTVSYTSQDMLGTHGGTHRICQH